MTQVMPSFFLQGRISGKNKSRTNVRDSVFALSDQSDCSGDLTGTHTPGTNIHMAGRTVNDCLHALHIGLPGTIGTTMRVRNANTKGNALVAKLALSHPLHLLAVAYFRALLTGTADIIAENFLKCKYNFQKNSRNL